MYYQLLATMACGIGVAGPQHNLGILLLEPFQKTTHQKYLGIRSLFFGLIFKGTYDLIAIIASVESLSGTWHVIRRPWFVVLELADRLDYVCNVSLSRQSML